MGWEIASSARQEWQPPLQSLYHGLRRQKPYTSSGKLDDERQIISRAQISATAAAFSSVSIVGGTGQFAGLKGSDDYTAQKLAPLTYQATISGHCKKQ